MDISLELVIINTKLTQPEIVKAIFDVLRQKDEDIIIIVNPTIKPEKM